MCVVRWHSFMFQMLFYIAMRIIACEINVHGYKYVCDELNVKLSSNLTKDTKKGENSFIAAFLLAKLLNIKTI